MLKILELYPTSLRQLGRSSVTVGQINLFQFVHKKMSLILLLLPLLLLQTLMNVPVTLVGTMDAAWTVLKATLVFVHMDMLELTVRNVCFFYSIKVRKNVLVLLRYICS